MNRTTFSILLIVVCFFFTTKMEAQKLVVESFTVAPTDISASQYPRNDLNGHPCGLVKVQLAVAGAQFEGNVIAPVENKTGEYWVYMTEGSKELVVKTPSTVPLHVNFTDHQISGIVPKTTYVLTLASSQNAVQQTGTLTIRYSPATAMVLIDSKPYPGTNGVVSVTLPVGSHDYIVAANDYETQEGSVKVRANQTINLPLTLSRASTSQAPTAVRQTAKPQTSVTLPPASAVVVTPPNAAYKTFTVNDVSFKMIKVEGGTFQMGSDSRDSDEKPMHQVTLTNDYYIGETEVTQALWMAVMGSEPKADGGWDYGRGDNYPAYRISWEDCQTFITKLNTITGKKFRLPTEAEWEFAARGGTKSKGYRYSGSNTIDDVAWYSGNAGQENHPVKTKLPNELGLYDMSGNMEEWCQDWYGIYSSSAQTNPTGPTSGSNLVRRGGGRSYLSNNCRVTARRMDVPSYTFSDLGLRLVLSNESLPQHTANETTVITPSETKTVKVHVDSAADGEPLAGCSVRYSDREGGAITNMYGDCILENVKEGQKIKVLFMGMLSKEITIDQRDTYEVALEEDTQFLSRRRRRL